MQITVTFLNSQKDLSEARERKYFFKKIDSQKNISEPREFISLKFSNSQNNISEAREFISIKYNHCRAQKDISEVLEQLPSSKDLSEAHRVF